MADFTSQFQEVLSSYTSLDKEFATILSVNNSQSLSTGILQHRDWLSQIEMMETRIAHLCDQWEKCRNQLGPEARREVSELAEAAKAQALHLLSLCQNSSQKLQMEHSNLQKDLAEIAKGARFIEGLKSAKNNYPKFIDSRY